MLTGGSLLPVRRCYPDVRDRRCGHHAGAFLPLRVVVFQGGVGPVSVQTVPPRRPWTMVLQADEGTRDAGSAMKNGWG